MKRIIIAMLFLVGLTVETLKADQAIANEVNNIVFSNDSDKTVYICSDNDFIMEVAARGTKRFGVEFFKGKSNTPSPKYFKIYLSKPASCKDAAPIKYALATGHNYRIDTHSAVKTQEKLPAEPLKSSLNPRNWY